MKVCAYNGLCETEYIMQLFSHALKYIYKKAQAKSF